MIQARIMNPVFSRMWQIVGAILILTLIIGIYFYTRFIQQSQPFSKLIDAQKYQVATLGDYVRYKRNPARFNNEYSSAGPRFDCERLRDDFVKLTQSIISPELSTSEETVVWREVSNLHLGDPSVSGGEAFAAWKNQVINLATVPRPREADHYGTILKALFTSISIHGRNAGEDFSVQTKRGSELDACG
jgi:hypothetical protein